MRYADHDCRVKALRLHFILNAQMETCVNKCKDRKQTSPGSIPVIPKIPATHPETIPMKERILSIFLRLKLRALGSKTSFVDDDASASAPGAAPPSRLAIGSIILT
jgi:hypothetical protein